MKKKNHKPLGIIQSRGLGDIVIALPIAHYYHQQGHEIYWPICSEFVSHFAQSVPWVNWIAVSTDTEYFWTEPMRLLRQLGVKEYLPLYQSLTGHKELMTAEFQITKFDEIKYHRAGVPFVNKWLLSDCITRNYTREQALYDQVVKTEHYVVAHLEGSSHSAQLDLDSMKPDSSWGTVEITALTDCIFDWLTVLERAEAIVAVDSVFANLVDQLGVGTDRYFIPRSHIHLTPVLGRTWHVLTPSDDVVSRIQIFRSA